MCMHSNTWTCKHIVYVYKKKSLDLSTYSQKVKLVFT
jgi:hypothetical protein